MDPIVATAAVAVVALVAIGAAVRQTLALGRLRRLTGASSGSDIERRIGGLFDRVTALELQSEQDARDLHLLVELLGVGIVHLTDDLDVDAANKAAHVLLRRAPGTMRDRPALEAFVDARIERAARPAIEVGAAAGGGTAAAPH